MEHEFDNKQPQSLKRKHQSRTFSSFVDRNISYILVLPVLLCITVVILYPSIRTILMSFYRVELLLPEQPFIGLENFINIIKDTGLLKIIYNTIFFSVASLFLATILALYSAQLLNKPYRGRGLYRTLLLIPWITPPVVMGAVWKVLYSENFSPLNGLLMGLGLRDTPFSFLGNTEWGFGPFNIPMLCLIVVNVWHMFPFMMVMFLAAMQSISKDYYEAATVEGLGKIGQFYKITLPLILPVLEITLLLEFVWQFNNFNSSYLLTQGGPLDMTNVLAVKVFQEAFINFKYSTASTISVLMFLVVLIPSVFYIKKRVQNEFKQ
ncbi:carbohydrate ABC transporter permease [Paenibacillus sp. GCM10027626]|uniref:carbohydrate ABC transporter permease n=1 Tax=Paenibacillus sp. GCM10027626 TaxID=3273411 RepID=UPI00362CF1C2